MARRINNREDALWWLAANDHDLAPITGTDARALRAIDHVWECFAYTRALPLLDAIRKIADTMQPHVRSLARELAAKAMDWGDRDRYWPLVYPPFQTRQVSS